MATNNSLVTFNSNITSLRTQNYLQQVLGEKKSAFVNNITALVANNKNLQTCNFSSVLYAGIKATALDLPLDNNLGFAYVIPFANNKTKDVDAQFQIGYKGYIQLAMRSGQFKSINVRDVREGELIEEDFLTGDMVFKKLPDEIRDDAKVIGYVAFFRLINGFEKTLYSSVAQIEKHAKTYSQTYRSDKDYIRNSSKWATDFDAMARKTVLKSLLSKWAPLSVDMRDAITADQAVLSENGVKYVDNDNSIDTDAEIIDESKDKAAEIIEQALNLTIEEEDAEKANASTAKAKK